MIGKISLLFFALFVAQSISLPQEELKAVVQSINDFSLKFLKEQNYGQENVLYSPLSIAAALGMVLGGARGQTAQEILKALQMPTTVSDQHIHEAMKQVLSAEESKKRENLTLEFAQLAAFGKGSPVEESFQQLAISHYEALLKLLDFSGEPQKSIDEINNFVNQKTHGMIKGVFKKPLHPLTRFVLVNTIYFKGTFVKKFFEPSTRKEDFTNSDKSKSKVDTMYQKSYINAASDDKQLVFELPYHGNVSLYVILPKETFGLNSVLETLTQEKLNHLISSLKRANYRLYMPKFEYAYEPELKETLEKLGAKSMFIHGVADFSGITKEKVYISKAVHKARIIMKEGGTEAAAVTAFAGGLKMAIHPPPIVHEIRVDHPFAYVIRDKTNNVDLFVGVVNKL